MSLQELDRIAKRDPLHPLTFQEKELLRGLEDDVRLYHPTLLPRMIDCVDYTNYQVMYQLRFFHPDVSEMRPTKSIANNQKNYFIRRSKKCTNHFKNGQLSTSIMLFSYLIILFLI